MRYIQLPQIVSDTCFGFFVVSWIIPRHVLFFIVIYSTAYVLPKTTPFVWDPSIGSYITDGVHYMFISFLLALQVGLFLSC
jgi:very-long-chain ceramide synthase